MDKKVENNLYIEVIEFGIRRPEGFTYDQLMDGLKLNDWKRKIINEYLETAYKNYNQAVGRGNADTPFLLAQIGPSQGFMHPSHKYIVSYDAHFKFIDYHELKFARESSSSARKLSVVAIIISVASVIVSVLIPLMINQTVRLENNQLQSILDASSKEPNTGGLTGEKVN